MSVITIECNWRAWRRWRRMLSILLDDNSLLYDRRDPKVTAHLENLLDWTDQVVEQLPPFEQGQIYVPLTRIGEDFHIQAKDNLTPEAQFVAARITDFLVVEEEEGFLDMSQEDRERFGEMELAITGGGCKAFHSPENWNRGAADWSAPASAILVLSYDGGSLAPYMNPSYERYDQLRRLKAMVNGFGYTFYQLSHVCSAIVPRKDGDL